MGKRPLFEISISVGTANSGVPMKTTRIVRPHSRKFEITKISFCPKLRTTPKNFISYSQRVEEVSGAALRTASLTFRFAKSIWIVPSGEFGGSFASDLVAFLASEEADRVACVFGFEPPSRVPNATMPPARPKPTTLAADKAYDAGEFAHELRSVNATPHVAQNTHPPLVGVRRPYHAPCRLRSEPKHP